MPSFSNAYRNFVVLTATTIVIVVFGAKYTGHFDTIYNAILERNNGTEENTTTAQLGFNDFKQFPTHYVHPLNKSITGLTFNLHPSYVKLVKRLISNLQTGVEVENITTDVLSQTIAPVTAISSDHFNKLMTNIAPLRRFKLPKMKLIVYDLGLTSPQILQLKKDNFIIYRRFNFSQFPSHVQTLKTYAFKFLVIQEVLAESGTVFWMDASILMNLNFTTFFNEMQQKRSGVLHYIGLARHSILGATHPKMLEYLPPKNFSHLKQVELAATGMILVNTKIVRESIMTWALFCSLDKECISPKGSSLSGCRSKPAGEQFPSDRYGGCHRYDQSMIAILDTNAFDGKAERYASSGALAETRRLG